CLSLLGDIVQKEMTPSKKNPVLVDGVVLNGPQTDVKAGEKFVEEACRLVLEEVVWKATDVKEKSPGSSNIPILGSTGNLANYELSLNLQVCEWQPPEQLRQLLDLEMRDTGEPQDKLLKLCQDVIHFSVKTRCKKKEEEEEEVKRKKRKGSK
ncbi:Glutamate decarboxylase-like protein 1, partial [Cricetulus griseus]